MSWRKTLALACALFVASPAWAAVGTIYVDTAANGGVNTSSGTTDTANSVLATCTGGTAWLVTTGCKGTAAGTSGGTSPNYVIVLDTNTNLTGMPVDGSQAIFYNNATNANDKIFWITTVTGCTGSGACSVTVNSSTGIQPACTTCTAVATWAIGGRITLPNTTMEGGTRGGDTVLVNSSIACGAAVCFSFRISGDTTNGSVTLLGKGNHPTLSNTGNNAVVSGGGNPANVVIDNITASSTGTAATIILNSGGANIVKSVIVNSSGSGACIGANTASAILDSELTGCTGAGITETASGIQIIGNYIHNVSGDCITDSLVAPVGVIADNILSTCGGWGINLSGATVTNTGSMTIEGNTFYNSTSGGLSVTSKQTSVRLRSNIFYNTIGSATNVSYPAVSGITDVSTLVGGSHKYNNFFVNGAGVTNFANVTSNATETLTDPVFTNGTGGDFAVGTGGGAFAIGGPNTWLNGGTTGYRSAGAAQLSGVGSTLNVGIVH